MTRDPEIQARVKELVSEAHVLLEAIRRLGTDTDDPLSDPATLALAVEKGLLDTPQLQRNPFARGEIRTRPIGGAIEAVGEAGEPLSEEERLYRLMI